jgi:hypothetical protein
MNCIQFARREVRFLADADLDKAIVSGVLRREPAVDFLTAQTAGLRRLKDPDVLALAAERQRVLVSHDVGTMSKHFRAFKETANLSPGVLLIPQSLAIGSAIEELLLIWLASEAGHRLAWRAAIIPQTDNHTTASAQPAITSLG